MEAFVVAMAVAAFINPTLSFVMLASTTPPTMKMQRRQSKTMTYSLPPTAIRIPPQDNDPTFVPPDIINNGQISEVACIDAAKLMRRVLVPVSTNVCATGTVGISYIHWKAAEPRTTTTIIPTTKQQQQRIMLPLLLVHGFDSSCLEYRRLGPILSSLGVDVYCVDLLGWGYTQLDQAANITYSAKAKIEALKSFWNVVGYNSDVVVGGASLGGAAVIEYAANILDEQRRNNDDDDTSSSSTGSFIRGMVLIDAQGFVDGIGPMSALPSPLAKLGISVLKSNWLRSTANQMSYYNKATFATEDALKIGRLHTLREGWENGMLSFMSSGGFRPMTKVSSIDVPSLILWGRQDTILDGEEFATKFCESMPNAQLHWIEECGHVPHLEQPEVTANVIVEFLMSKELRPSTPAVGGSLLDGLLGFLK
jgi:pimeloyl-ACP methyl ester carboxylesterase